jgi:hypothetical protein
MTLAWLLLVTGLVISAVAIYYSVIGLAAVFAAAAIPVYIMGTTLEVAKLVCASWLKANWERIPALMKLYMTTAVIVLMLITSMGIFGFLSKAHLDQNIVSGDVQSKIALVDEKVKIERENIANAQQVIKQMDAAVNGVLTTGDQEVKLRDGSTRVNSAAERSLQIRRSQAKDRDALTKQIEQAQSRIVTLQEEVAPIRAEMRQVEAKVGPIKYIAALIYGDNPDANILEKAVTWVIIIIVVVFDPLAIIMLLAAQMTFQWHRRKDDEITSDKLEPTVGPTVGVIAQEVASVIPEAVVTVPDDSVAILKVAKEKLAQFVDKVNLENKPEPLVFETVKGFDVPKVDNVPNLANLTAYTPNVKELNIQPVGLEETEEAGLEAWNKMLEEAEQAVREEKESNNKFPADPFTGQQFKLVTDDKEQYYVYNGTNWVKAPLNGEAHEPADEDNKKYKIFPELINTNYVQNEEQVESGLWQETTQSLSQNDYQQKVLEANIRSLVESINDGSILIEQLTEDEALAVEEYLKKESNDGQDNDSKST